MSRSDDVSTIKEREFLLTKDAREALARVLTRCGALEVEHTALKTERDALFDALKKMGCQRRRSDGRRAPVCGEDPRDVEHGDADWALCPVCRLTMPDRVERVQQQALEARERRKSRAEQKMRGGK